MLARTPSSESLAAYNAARTFKRLAHGYKRWALEAENAGNLDRYKHYRKEAERLWKSARQHIIFARRWREK